VTQNRRNALSWHASDCGFRCGSAADPGLAGISVRRDSVRVRLELSQCATHVRVDLRSARRVSFCAALSVWSGLKDSNAQRIGSSLVRTSKQNSQTSYSNPRAGNGAGTCFQRVLDPEDRTIALFEGEAPSELSEKDRAILWKVPLRIEPEIAAAAI
jgi:hypothetical protein